MTVPELEPYCHFHDTPPEHENIVGTATVKEVLQKFGRPCFDAIPLFPLPDGFHSLGSVIRENDFSGPWICGSGTDWSHFLPGPDHYARHIVRNDLQIDVADTAKVVKLNNRHLYQRTRPIPEVLEWSCVIIDNVNPRSIVPSEKYLRFVTVSTRDELHDLLLAYTDVEEIQWNMLDELWTELQKLKLVA